MNTLDPTRPDDGADAWSTPGGLVTVTAPAGTSPYYRLEWYAVEGQRKRQQPTGGRTFEKAWGKAVQKEAELLAGATPKSQLPSRVGIQYWLDPNRPTPKGGWGYSMDRNMSYYARTYFVPTFGHARHMDLRRSHFQACVDKTPTRSEGANVRRSANNLIAALRQGDYLLESQVIDLSNEWRHGSDAGTSGEVSGADGETDEERSGFVPKWSRPSNEQVRALREAAEQVGRGIWWRGLMVELAAYAGPRRGEPSRTRRLGVRARTRKVNIHWRVAFERGNPAAAEPAEDGEAAHHHLPGGVADRLSAGWQAVRIWEHEPLHEAAERVRATVSARTWVPSPPGRPATR